MKKSLFILALFLVFTASTSPAAPGASAQEYDFYDLPLPDQ